MRIKVGQKWKDKKTGDIMYISARHHDVYWQCVFERSQRKSHKMNEFIIKKYYALIA